jgi:hypothetical protein
MRREHRADMMLMTFLGLITATWVALLVLAVCAIIES